MTTVILDADSLLYKAGFSAETTTRQVTIKGEDSPRASFNYVADMKEWLSDNELTLADVDIEKLHSVAPPGSAITILDSIIKSIVAVTEPSNLITFIGGSNNFRYDIYPRYKESRANVVKPVHYDLLFNHLKASGAIIPEGMEADDAVCMTAWKHLLDGDDYIIAGIDKDLKQIPGTHYDYGKNTFIEIDDWEASFNLYSQLLTGDSDDDIPGLRGVGPVTARKILQDCDDERDMYRVCVDQWKERGPGSAEEENYQAMCLSMNLLYLLRFIDDKWEPPV